MSYNSFAFLENDVHVSPVKANNQKVAKNKDRSSSQPVVQPMTPPMEPVEGEDEDMESISLDAMKIVFAERGFTPEQVEFAYTATVSSKGSTNLVTMLAALEEARAASVPKSASQERAHSDTRAVQVTSKVAEAAENTTPTAEVLALHSSGDSASPVVALKGDEDLYFLPPGANASVARLPGAQQLVFAADSVPSAGNTNAAAPASGKKRAKAKDARNKTVSFAPEPVAEPTPVAPPSPAATPLKGVLKTPENAAPTPAEAPASAPTAVAPVPAESSSDAAPAFVPESSAAAASPASSPPTALAAISSWDPRAEPALPAIIADAISAAAAAARTATTATALAQGLVEGALAEQVVKALVRAHTEAVATAAAAPPKRTLAEGLLTSSARLLALAYGVPLTAVATTLAQLAELLSSFPHPDLTPALFSFAHALHLALCVQRSSPAAEVPSTLSPPRWGSAGLPSQAARGDAVHQLLAAAEATTTQTYSAIVGYGPLARSLDSADAATHDMQLAFHLLEKRCCDKVAEIDRRLTDARKHIATAAAAHSEAAALSAQARAPVEMRKRELVGQLDQLRARREQLQRELDALDAHITTVEASLSAADARTGSVASQFAKREQETEALVRARTVAAEAVESEQRAWGAVRQLTVAAYHVAATASHGRVAQLTSALEKQRAHFISALVAHLSSGARMHAFFAQRVNAYQTQLAEARARKAQAVAMAMPAALVAQHAAMEQQLAALVQADSEELLLVARQASAFLESVVRTLTADPAAVTALHDALTQAQLPFDLGRGGALLQTAYSRAAARHQDQSPSPVTPAAQQAQQPAQPQQPQQSQQQAFEAPQRQQQQQQQQQQQSKQQQQAGDQGMRSRAPPRTRAAPAAKADGVAAHSPATATANTTAGSGPAEGAKEREDKPRRNRGGRSKDKQREPSSNNNNKVKSPAPASAPASAPAVAPAPAPARPAWAAPKAPSERYSLFE